MFVPPKLGFLKSCDITSYPCNQGAVFSLYIVTSLENFHSFNHSVANHYSHLLIWLATQSLMRCRPSVPSRVQPEQSRNGLSNFLVPFVFLTYTSRASRLLFSPLWNAKGVDEPVHAVLRIMMIVQMYEFHHIIRKVTVNVSRLSRPLLIQQRSSVTPSMTIWNVLTAMNKGQKTLGGMLKRWPIASRNSLTRRPLIPSRILPHSLFCTAVVPARRPEKIQNRSRIPTPTAPTERERQLLARDPPSAMSPFF